MVTLSPTSYPEVNQIIHLLHVQVKKTLQEQFTGLYLYGSLSSGDFDPRASDIDFLAVTTGPLSQETIAGLESMHYQLWNTGLKWVDKLEGSYLPASHLCRYVKNNIAYPTVNEGRFYLAPHGSDWVIQRHIIREHGWVLAGPDPKTLIDPVSPEDIRSAVKDNLQEWWFPMLVDLPGLKSRGSQYHAYAILTMCRSLYAMQYGEIISKPAAARWAGKVLGGRWPVVFEQALAVRLGKRDFNLFEQALELVRHTKECIESFEGGS